VTDIVLEVRDLTISFRTPRGLVRALRGVDLTVPRSRIVGIVGESGSGKTTLISAALGLLAPNAIVEGGRVLFDGRDVLAMTPAELDALRGRRIAMVFQDPMTSLNPVVPIGRQMVHIQHRDPASAAAKRSRAIAALERVGIADAADRFDDYPHRFSGGMRQRIAIAMALLMKPALLIADEPTTALDVTLEAQIIYLLKELREELAGTILFVSHNLGLIAEMCDEVAVMYAGEVVERADVATMFHGARHPYTRLLLACDPARIEARARLLPTIPGEVPDLLGVPAGCPFAPRCPDVRPACLTTSPGTYAVAPHHDVRCLLARDADAA
jgi:oligopeptide/dipeptide ABC transporter ATP-binding protein